jgi:hypothetical protein
MKFSLDQTNTPWRLKVLFHIPMLDAFEEGNLVNISKTITIYISIKPGVTENILIRATCTFKEVTAYQSLFHPYPTEVPSFSCPLTKEGWEL